MMLSSEIVICHRDGNRRDRSRSGGLISSGSVKSQLSEKSGMSGQGCVAKFPMIVRGYG